jgi:hypothetical protein
MELALAKKEAKARSALILASWQLLLLIAIAYGVAYIVPACLGTSTQVEEEPLPSVFHSSGLKLYAELDCESAAPTRKTICPASLNR